MKKAKTQVAHFGNRIADKIRNNKTDAPPKKWRWGDSHPRPNILTA